ncbi:MAG: thioredoxin family protein [Bacteroidota bacterium]
MALTPSTMLALGTQAPDFTLPDTMSDQQMSLKEFRAEKGTVIMFICNHCPYVKHVNDELVKLANDYQSKGISFVAISSNDVEKYPEDSPAKMKEYGEQLGYPFPYLFDESQDVAKAYEAACTPDFYIFDQDLSLAYRGQLDDSRPNSGKPVTGADMRAALDQLVAGVAVSTDQVPSMGCNIKWK